MKFKNNISLKAGLSYAIVAIAMILIIALVYVNTRSLNAISTSVGEYARMQQHADSALAGMMADERESLQQLNEAMALSRRPGALRRRMDSLNSGKDSVVVHSKATETHHVSTTTVEVARSRRGFFHRLADLFHSSHSDTVSVRRDSTLAGVDTVARPVDVSHRVASILADAEREDHKMAQHDAVSVNSEMRYLKALTDAIAREQARKVTLLQAQERKIVSRSLADARRAQERLVMQLALLAAIAILLGAFLVWRIRRDVTREAAYRQALQEANEKIRRVMDQREQLLLTITHDIKAPAASIAGFTELLKEYTPSAKGRDLLNSVNASATHLSHLVADLLDYHRLESGEMALSETTFSPAQLFNVCVMGFHQRAQTKGLTLDADTSACKAMTCYGDAYRIRQIADNLLGNAVKYTDAGSILLTASIVGTTLRFQVRDTGRGMGSEECNMAFQPFKRLAAAQGTEGTGLGLSIVSRLTTLLGGTVSVNSEEGKGSTFSVTIPIKDVRRNTAVVKQEAAIVKQEKTTRKQASGDIRHLLILDDDPLQLRLLQETVRRIADKGWQVKTCGHVTEALTALHDIRPDILLVDIEMPEMSGIDFIQHIDHHGITTVAMTAHDASIIPQLHTAGFDACLLKPVKATELALILGSCKGHGEDDSSYHTTTQSSEQTDFLALFSDSEDRRQILEAVHTEVADFKHRLQSAIESSADKNIASTPPDRDLIVRTAHKLLPIAKMLNLDSVPILEQLTPQQIAAVSDRELTAKVKKVIQSLANCFQ